LCIIYNTLNPEKRKKNRELAYFRGVEYQLLN